MSNRAKSTSTPAAATGPVAQAKVVVKDFVIEEEKPHGLSQEAMSKIQNIYHPIKCSLVLENVDQAIANGMRRTMSQELLVSHLTFDETTFLCNDVFLLPDMIKKRFNLLPIAQDISPDAIFELVVDNRTPLPMTVYTTDMRIIKNAKKIPCNKYPMFELASGCSIKLKSIRVEQKFGYEYGFGGLVAFQCASVPVDVRPIEQRDIADRFHDYKASIAEALKSGTDSALRKLKHGLPSAISNPSVYRLSFYTNGNILPETVLAMTCASLIERLEYVKNITPITEQGIYKLVVKGESDTIGNIILKTGLSLYPNCMLAYNADTTMRSITITVNLATVNVPNITFNVFITSIISAAIAKIKQIEGQV
ncbi:putative DNA-directed RNA polymerase subunit D [Faustovirus]|nr:putative DNA-directed RNA polymerase subunit D [Faustovirus]